MTQDHFLFLIPFVGRSGVTDPYRNQILKFELVNSSFRFKIKHVCGIPHFHNASYGYLLSCFIYSEALVTAVFHKILINSKNS